MFEFMAQNQMYVVLSIVVLVWAGIVGYLVRLDRRVRQLEHLTGKES